MHPAQYQPGQILPGTVYRVVRHLATGGMGSVYDVEDVTVEKRYVLKTLHPNLVAREDLALRMRDEARSLGKLQHPNIVDVVTAGVTSDAQKMPFYVMERLIGQNLRVVLEKTGVLRLAHACRIAIDLADALEHAHENNIVHRDVKPENLFLHRNASGTTTTKLLDFGIVHLLDRKASHTHGKFIGTLRYASPEQITGGRVGPATDIYSLGVVLFEMLCGRGPFDEAGDAYAVGAAHTNTPAPPLSRFLRGVAPDVERLVASTLAKDPADRPRDCFAVASELRRILREDGASPRSAPAVNLVTSASPPAEAAGGVVSPIAPTLAASEKPATDKLGPLPAPAPAPATGSPAKEARALDRSALTRESAPVGSPPRFAPNDTEMVELEAGVRHDGRAGAPVHLEAEPVAVRHPGSNPGELAFPPAQAANATGPLAGEATTRPPDRGPFILIGIAAVLAVAMVGGAIAVVSKPWQAPAAAATPKATSHASPAAPSSAANPASASAPTSSMAPPAVAPMAIEPVPAPPPPPPPTPPKPRAAGQARAGGQPRAAGRAPAPMKEIPFDP